MKDEIKKKIGEEALRYQSNLEHDHRSPSEYFFNGAECGYSLAQQSVNSELVHALKEIKEGVSEYQKDNKTDILDWVIKFADIALLSASQNQQNEKKICEHDFENIYSVSHSLELMEFKGSVCCKCGEYEDLT